MLLSYVLRLDADDLAEGRVVGLVEEVRTGTFGPVHDVEDLVAFLSSWMGRIAGSEDKSTARAQSGEGQR